MKTRTALATAALALAAVTACRQAPSVGDPVTPPVKPVPGLQLTPTTTRVASGRVSISFAAVRDGARLTGPEVEALGLAWTLAALGTEPESDAPAWRSLVLNGATLVTLPSGGPGSRPANVFPNDAAPATPRQPGAETDGTYTDNGFGTVTYEFATPLPADVTAATTLRAGVYLPSRTVAGGGLSATVDFRADRLPVTTRELVVDAACLGCHAAVTAHDETRAGTKLCLTCHTWQNADPETVDPAALALPTADDVLGTFAATRATDPNPLELGRLVHRIHRGKNLPTLYTSSNTAVLSGPPYPVDWVPVLPFFPGRNAPQPGASYSVVAEHGRERVFGRVVTRVENGQPGRVMAAGLTFPRDLRSCDACHAGAADEPVVYLEASRRSCQGCHPDVWFGDTAADAVHFPHTGGPQADDSACLDCHGENGAYVPIGPSHVPPQEAPGFDAPVVTIVGVENLVPPAPEGQPANPPITIKYRVEDRMGTLSPSLAAPVPAEDADHPVKRRLSSLSVTIAGPTAPDYSAVGNNAISESIPLSCTSGANCGAIPDESGVFTYRLAAKLPAGASGTWAVAMDARRANSAPPYFVFDAGANRFPWPYTRESLTEAAYNPLVYVDVAAGTLGAGAPVERRKVVDEARCVACHDRFLLHGGQRQNVAYCLLCHTPDRTDWARRPKNPGGDVNLSTVRSATDFGTYDGVEERTVHMKVMIHRIHTGQGVGTASLDGIEPHVIYGYPGGPTAAFFLDEGEFPGDLADCRTCHLPGTYDVVPEGAAPTIANETGTLRHGAARPHGEGERATPALTAACLGCHATAWAEYHVAKFVSGTTEQCASCHAAGAAYGTAKVHGFDPE